MGSEQPLQKEKDYGIYRSPRSKLPFLVEKESVDVLDANIHYGRCIDSMIIETGSYSVGVRNWFISGFSQDIEIDSTITGLIQEGSFEPVREVLSRIYIETLLNLKEAYIPFFIAADILHDENLMLDIFESAINREQTLDIVGMIGKGVSFSDADNAKRWEVLRRAGLKSSLLDLDYLLSNIAMPEEIERISVRRMGLAEKGKFNVFPDYLSSLKVRSRYIMSYVPADMLIKHDQGKDRKLYPIPRRILALALSWDTLPEDSKVSVEAAAEYLYENFRLGFQFDFGTFLFIFSHCPEALRYFEFDPDAE